MESINWKAIGATLLPFVGSVPSSIMTKGSIKVSRVNIDGMSKLARAGHLKSSQTPDEEIINLGLQGCL